MMSDNPTDRTTIGRVARALRRRGLRLPALLLLDAGAPLMPILGQLLYVGQPALALVTGRSAISTLAGLLEDPAAVAALIDDLEQP